MVVGNGSIDNPVDGIEMGTGAISDRIMFHDIQIYGTNLAGAIAMRLLANAGPITVSNVDILGSGFPGGGIRAANDVTFSDGEFYFENVKMRNCGYVLFPSSGSSIKKVSIVGGEVLGATTDLRIETGGTLDELIYKGVSTDNISGQLSVSGSTGLPKKLDLDISLPASTTNATLNTVVSLPIQDNTVYRVECNFTAMQDTGAEVATYTKMALLRRNGAGAVIEGVLETPIADIESAGAMAWDAGIAVGGNDIRARVLGAAATNIDWALQLKIKSAI